MHVLLLFSISFVCSQVKMFAKEKISTAFSGACLFPCVHLPSYCDKLKPQNVWYCTCVPATDVLLIHIQLRLKVVYRAPTVTLFFEAVSLFSHLSMKYSDMAHLSTMGYRGVKRSCVTRNQRRAPRPPTTPPQTTWEGVWYWR